MIYANAFNGESKIIITKFGMKSKSIFKQFIYYLIYISFALNTSQKFNILGLYKVLSNLQSFTYFVHFMFRIWQVFSREGCGSPSTQHSMIVSL